MGVKKTKVKHGNIIKIKTIEELEQTFEINKYNQFLMENCLVDLNHVTRLLKQDKIIVGMVDKDGDFTVLGFHCKDFFGNELISEVVQEEVEYLIDFNGNLEENEEATGERVLAYAKARLESNPEDAVEFIFNNGLEDDFKALLLKATQSMTIDAAKAVIASYGEEVVDLNKEYPYSVFAISENGTENIDSAGTEDEAKELVSTFKDQLAKGDFKNNTSLEDITDFKYDTL